MLETPRRRAVGARPMLLFCTLLCMTVGTMAGCGDPADDSVVSGPAGPDITMDFDSVINDAADEDAGEPVDQGTALPDADEQPAQPCKGNDECDSGYCIDTFDGKVCAKTCVTDCAEDYVCKLVDTGAGDATSICVPRFPRICDPCQSDSDCSAALGGGKSLCVPYSEQGENLGAFCGGGCGADVTCPEGWQCVDVVSVGGAKAKQCQRADLTCPCSARAKELGLVTGCSTTNGAGTCTGKRACNAKGLGACDAPAAVSETCNTQDDDCDGNTDEADPGVCDDNMVCTADSCNAGKCNHLPQAGACDDNNACTSDDACTEGKCIGTKVVCDDNNTCTIDGCDAIKGCVHNEQTGPACDDGDACTTKDICNKGVCTGGPALDCNDDNLCTDDSCDKKTGCTHLANSVACDDGDACTLADACTATECKGPGKQSCDDGNPCTTDGCDAKTACTHVHNTGACDDGNACTKEDVCASGKCAAKPVTCSDGQVCTTDGCDPAKGCTFTPNSSACDDGSACTVGDGCAAGKCQPGKALVCNDGNVCTVDECEAKTGCSHVHAKPGAPCSDGSVCTESDGCLAGKCAPGKPKSCDDGKLCTNDTCHHLNGCAHPANALPCDDGNACTANDGCKAGTCAPGNPVTCADGNVCTDDACDKAKGCVFTHNSAGCNDGNTCSDKDICKAGACTPGGPKVCDDKNNCTTDGCHWKNGCLHVANTAPCDDGNACTKPDACKDKSCAAGAPLVCDDGKVCTDDSCDKTKGCQHAPNSAKCSDGDVCTLTDSCLGGFCIPGKKKSCSDGELCTDDGCDKAKGCTFTANTKPCSDNSKCTLKDTCTGGKCAPGAAPNCDDGKLCTDDACAPATGCTHKANTKPCSDGNACTTNDICTGGSCKPGSAKNCNDNKLCTTDFCDASKGCINANNAAPCSDGSVCTLNDACNGGSCKPGSAKKCDDGNPCTLNGCDKGQGCTTKNVANGKGCGAAKWCQSGKCVPKTVGTKSNPALSCKHILDSGSSKGNGSYWIDPNGGGIGDAFSAVCLMSVAGGGWTKLYPNVASSLHGNTTKEYLYLYGNRWYRSPKTTLKWSWSSGKQLTGSYAYFNGSKGGSYTCKGSGETPHWGVGCSNGGGGQYKTLTYYGKNPNAAQGTVCQDKPGALCGCACRSNTTMYVRGH